MVLIPASSVTPFTTRRSYRGMGGHFGAPHLYWKKAFTAATTSSISASV
jgi:hypothetical protein